jgi:GAF domain-containing protein
VIGTVQVLNRNGHGAATFSPRDLRLLEAMAQQAAVSLQRSLLLEEAEREKEREAKRTAYWAKIEAEDRGYPVGFDDDWGQPDREQ